MVTLKYNLLSLYCGAETLIIHMCFLLQCHNTFHTVYAAQVNAY